MIDETQPEAESDLRRRAAWLLGMLALVAVLLVVVMTTLLGGSGDDHGNKAGPLDSVVNASSTSASASHQSVSSTATHASTSASSSSASASSSGTGTTPVAGARSCPGTKTCVLDGDIGHGIEAINDYRTAHGQPAVSGAVSAEAQHCAMNNGNGCSGGWAETELSKPNGSKAVQKILPFARLLDPNLKNFEVGWAYDPDAKLYYFAIIRND